MMTLYNLLFTAALILYFPRLFFKKGPENRERFIKERLGLSDYDKTDIWVHAVSVGETLASLSFLKNLKKEFPGKKIVLTTTTYTGQKVAQDKFPEADRIMYMPLDASLCVRRVVHSLRPELFITVETELWPALFYALKKNGSRIIIVNGRISNTSFKGYRKVAFLIRKVLSNVDYLYMQDTVYAERIIALGADRANVGIMGNFKFDIDFSSSTPLHWVAKIKGRILLAASTHKGEEEIMLDAYASIQQQFQDVRLILAPRHPERFSEVEDILRERGYSYRKRSEIDQGPAVSGRQRTTENELPDIILLDTIGELSRAFSDVTIAFIGGSLVPVGGHNILEPAYWSKPVLFGPHMDNFPISEDFLTGNAGIQVRNAQDLEKAISDLLNDSEKAVTMGRNAKAIVDKNTGAVKKAIELIRGFIGTA